jgi:lipopolysaccharide/colanic/teichoic acid biosynthesis glycosyltransferase
MRALDILFALVGLIVGAPLFALLYLCVRIGIGAPTLFRQNRMGIGSRQFNMVKFRSMLNSTNAAGTLLPDELRTPKMGRWLRRSRLDELPELWNILRGEMAVVGPRPLLPETIAAMGALGEKRCAVRPGLTGWAQVNGNALLSRDDKLSLDLWYIDHRSFWLDLTIIARTVAVVIGGEKINSDNVEKAYAGRCHRGR